MKTYRLTYVNPFSCCDVETEIDVLAADYDIVEDCVTFYIDYEKICSYNGVLNIKNVSGQLGAIPKIKGYVATKMWMDEVR